MTIATDTVIATIEHHLEGGVDVGVQCIAGIRTLTPEDELRNLSLVAHAIVARVIQLRKDLELPVPVVEDAFFQIGTHKAVPPESGPMGL